MHTLNISEQASAGSVYMSALCYSMRELITALHSIKTTLTNHTHNAGARYLVYIFSGTHGGYPPCFCTLYSCSMFTLSFNSNVLFLDRHNSQMLYNQGM